MTNIPSIHNSLPSPNKLGWMKIVQLEESEISTENGGSNRAVNRYPLLSTRGTGKEIPGVVPLFSSVVSVSIKFVLFVNYLVFEDHSIGWHYLQ